MTTVAVATAIGMIVLDAHPAAVAITLTVAALCLTLDTREAIIEHRQARAAQAR
ncbi:MULTISPECIES: hypothetical protein [unclassified Corynebacterium]|uniref:hypothetical protein n=1 Tax=unclassified Corynebacterium TaxID=2624378 RepID=UPI0029CA75FD|nr:MULTISPECIES: hypothetical protein [unclassified Corynebacterium]WPF66267.1 hypothetical protein OLX12_00610 [Corynebacterium sp. 22KM0430]WPF68757.1 hypothetical protein OLW90_00610 [Corynebacterium sp. 21KM1197]